jgi:hypothetical protein
MNLHLVYSCPRLLLSRLDLCFIFSRTKVGMLLRNHVFHCDMVSAEWESDVKEGGGGGTYVERISLGRLFVNVYIRDGNSVSLELASIFVHTLGGRVAVLGWNGGGWWWCRPVCLSAGGW